MNVTVPVGHKLKEEGKIRKILVPCLRTEKDMKFESQNYVCR